jgi:hypothetical protein
LWYSRGVFRGNAANKKLSEKVGEGGGGGRSNVRGSALEVEHSRDQVAGRDYCSKPTALGQITSERTLQYTVIKIRGTFLLPRKFPSYFANIA